MAVAQHTGAADPEKGSRRSKAGVCVAKDAAAQVLRLLQAGRVGGRKPQKRSRLAAAVGGGGARSLQLAREREISLDAVQQYEAQLAAYKQRSAHVPKGCPG